MTSRTWKRLAALAALLLVPSIAVGYGVLVHNLLPARALGDLKSLTNTPVKSTTLTGVRTADIERFRLWFYTQARTLPDTAARNGFARRYPTPASFDVRAFKEFLMMNGTAAALGFDAFPTVYQARGTSHARLDPYPQYVEGATLPLGTALAMGSLWVDFDRRNADRLFRGPDGQVKLTASGDTIPFDPMTLNMGALTGVTSENHAHFGLNHLPKSSDDAVLRSAPYNYVVAYGFPGTVETYAEQNTQIYTDLSLLTLLEGGSGMQALSSLYAGAALHYLADVSDAVHTLQGGTPGMTNDVTLARLIRQIKSGFGLWGVVPTREAISRDILTNMRDMSEKLFQAELAEAMSQHAQGNTSAIPESMRGAVDALTNGDTAKAVSFHALVNNAINENKNPEFGRLLASAVIDERYEDGAAIMRFIRAIANTDIRRASLLVDFDTIPDARVWSFVGSRNSANTQRALRRFNELQVKGLAIANEGLVAWWYAYGLIANPPAAKRMEQRNTVLTRVVLNQLAYLTAAETRRQQWIGTHGGARN